VGLVGVAPRNIAKAKIPVASTSFVLGLEMDFLAQQYALQGAYSAAFPTGWSFTRATAGNAQNADGSWVAFTSGQPRITTRGLCIEEARTNLFLNSSAPVTQAVTLATGTYQVTVWGSTGSVTTSAGTATATGYGAISASTFGTSQAIVVTVGGTITVTVAGSPLYVQVELGTMPSTHILTAGASATRNMDAVLVTGISSVLSQPYVLYADADLPLGDGLARTFLTSSAGSDASRLYVGRSAGNVAILGVTGGVGDNNVSVSGFSGAQASMRTAGRIRSTGLCMSANGTLSSDAPQTPPTGHDRVNLGTNAAGTSNMKGYLRRIGVRPISLTDAELIGITA